MNRRYFLIGTGAMLATSWHSVGHNRRSTQGPGIALTIDDFGWNDHPLMSANERDSAIRKVMKAENLQAAAFQKANM